MFRALCAHHQEVRIVLYSIWYHHNCMWMSGAQGERRLFSQPVHRTAYYALSSLLLLPPYSAQISSVPSSRTPSAYDPPRAWGTMFGVHIIRQILTIRLWLYWLPFAQRMSVQIALWLFMALLDSDRWLVCGNNVEVIISAVVGVWLMHEAIQQKTVIISSFEQIR